MGTRKTMQDVAEAAQVSRATVSRVANGAETVGLELQRRVREAAQKLGVDLARSNRPKILAFVLSNRNMLHPFHSQVLVGAQNHCAARGWDMLFLSFDYSPNPPWNDLHLPLILRRRDIVRAAILSGTNSQNLLLSLTRRGLPFVVLGNNVIGEWQPKNYDVVWSDDIGGAYETTRYLQSIGHRDIWHVGNYELPWFARCYEGYSRAMAEAGLPCHPCGQHSAQAEEIGYLATKSILARREPVSAIVAGSDVTALGVYKALNDRGIRIPEDISVVGQGDAGAAGLHPLLTTSQEFPELVGSHMAEIVLNRIAHPDQPCQHVAIPTKLVRRESCRPIPSAPQMERQEQARVMDSRPDTQLDTRFAK